MSNGAKKKTIVFVNPPLSLEERYGKLSGAGSTMPSLGLLSLAAAARANGFRSYILEASSLGLDYQATIEEIFKYSPDYVGITATTLSIYNAAKLAEKIKKMDERIPIIIGGVHLTAAPEETMSNFKQFDVGIIGEGEETVVELLQSDNKQRDLRDIRGLIIRDGESFHLTEKRPFIEDLDKLPLPVWDLLTGFPKAYHPPSFRFRRLPAASIVTSRGCPMKCIFCDRSVFGNKCRWFSAEYIIEMIKTLNRKYGVREILVEDDTFVISKPRLIAICEKLLKEDLNLSWSCLARVDMVDSETLFLMKRAGCWQISYGIESGAQEILDFIKKRITLEQIETALKWTKEAGIETKGFFMLGHPTETIDTIEKTIKFAKRIDLDDFSIFKFTPLPGSEIYKVASQYGKFNDDWKKMNLLETVFVPKGLTKNELEKYSRLALRRFYLRPKIILVYLKRIIVNPRNLSKIFKGFIAFLQTIFERKDRNIFGDIYNFILFPIRVIFPDNFVESLGLTSLMQERNNIVLKYCRGHLLDIGCKYNILVKKYGNGIGIDVYPWDGVDIVYDSKKLPFDNKTFDTITFVAVLNHIPNRLEILREANRVLKDNGQILITMIDPLLSLIGHKLIWVWWDPDQKIKGIEKGEKWGLSKKEIKELLKKSGFKLIRHIKFIYGLNNLYIAQKDQRFGQITTLKFSEGKAF